MKATLEIKKRHGDSRQNFATEEEIFWVVAKNLLFQESFNIELILRCLFLQTVAKLSKVQCRFL